MMSPKSGRFSRPGDDDGGGAVQSENEQEIRALIREIVLEMAPEPPQGGQEDPELVHHLGYHSLALLEMAFALEDEFALPPIDQESALSISRVSDVERYVLGQLAAREGADGPARDGADRPAAVTGELSARG
jgi:acyl carrier protein